MIIPITGNFKLLILASIYFTTFLVCIYIYVCFKIILSNQIRTKNFFSWQNFGTFACYHALYVKPSMFLFLRKLPLLTEAIFVINKHNQVYSEQKMTAVIQCFLFELTMGATICHFLNIYFFYILCCCGKILFSLFTMSDFLHIMIRHSIRCWKK